MTSSNPNFMGSGKCDDGKAYHQAGSGDPILTGAKLNLSSTSAETARMYEQLGWDEESLKSSLHHLISRYLQKRYRRKLKSIEEITISSEEARGHRQGTKSSAYELEIKFIQEGKRLSDVETFFIKQYNGKSNDMTNIEGRRFFLLLPPEENPYETEKAVLTFTTTYMPPAIYRDLLPDHELQAFPMLLSINSKAFGKRRSLLLQAIKEETLEDRVSESNMSGLSTILNALNPVVLLHEVMPRRMKESELELLKNNESLDLKRIENGNYFVGSVIQYLEIINEREISGTQKEGLTRGIKEIADKLINPTNKDFMITTIQKDGFPFHNMFISLVDAGGVVYGHRAFHLGCLLGHPSVYGRLWDPKENLNKTISAYLSKCRIAGNGSGYLLSGGRELEKELLDATYAAAIFGNLKVAAGIIHHRSGESIKPYLNTAEDQLKYFGDRGKKFRTFSRIFL